MNSIVSNNKKIENTKEKEYIKFINFGKLYSKENTFLSNSDNFINELKKDLGLKFADKPQYIIDKKYDSKQQKVVLREEKLVFTKLDSSNEYFFGTFSRVSNNKDVLTDIIDNTSQEKISPDSIYFEHNTLFYIDFERQAVSFIKTNHIKNVYPFLELFINDNNILNIGIAPLVKTEKEIQESIITQVEITCATTEIDPNAEFVEMKNLEKMGCKVKDYKLSVSLENTKTSFSKNLLAFCSRNKKKLKKMSISTSNENIDLLTNTFTKSVPIKLNNNYEQDYSTIQYALRNELIKAIQ